MKRSILFTLSLILLFGAGCARKGPEAGFVSMFNGKDLTGWDGQPGEWWIEDGAITSESTPEKPCTNAHYLYWAEDEPSDFVLRFKYKLIGGNSGVQIRSQKRPDYDTWGYQADIEAGDQWSGCLFQHDRKGGLVPGAVVTRGHKAVISEEGVHQNTQFADSMELQKCIKKDDWNEYEVSALGSKVTLKINGELMCEVDDRDKEMACSQGVIALQMHPGPPMKIQFKDLYIKVEK